MNAPFQHDELEVKQKFLEVARDFAKAKEVEKELAAAMLYANLCEYLAGHLLESLKQTVFSGSRTFWNGVVYLDARNTSEKLTIGQMTKELRQFGFPSKELIIPLLERITKNRNKVMHNLLRLPASEIAKIDQAIGELFSDSEELIAHIDDIYRALPPTNITNHINSNPETHVEAVADDSGEVKVEEKVKK